MAGKDMINAFLGAGAVFEGQLHFKGMVRVDCQFTGVIRSEGVLILGEKARVDGEIHVEQLISNGRITGNVTARNRVTLQKNSSLQGNLATPYLDVEEGAILEGQVLMKREANAMAPLAAQPPVMATPPAGFSMEPLPPMDGGADADGEEPRKKGWFKR